MCLREDGDLQFTESFINKKCEWNIGERVEQTEKLCDEVETVRESTCLGDMESAGEDVRPLLLTEQCVGGLGLGDAELLYGKKFPLKLKGNVYKSYVKPEILTNQQTDKKSNIQINQHTSQPIGKPT